MTSTGNVYTFGDAAILRCTRARSPPITSAVATPDGNGYWILVADGQVFAYGDADAASARRPPGDSAGSTRPRPSSPHLTARLLGRPRPWAVFNFGDAPNDGDMAGTHLNGAIIAASGF